MKLLASICRAAIAILALGVSASPAVAADLRIFPPSDVHESDSVAIFTVRCVFVGNAPISVNYQTFDGTAKAGSDYTAASGLLTWLPGDAPDKTIAIAVRGDLIPEGQESFTVRLNNPTAGSAINSFLSEASAVIIDDEANPAGRVQILETGTSVSEGAGNATLTLRRSNGKTGAISVTISTGDSTATAPSDYTAVTQVVTWADNDDADKTVLVPIVNDAALDPDEHFTASLSAPTGGVVIEIPTRTIVIADDDAPAAGILEFTTTAKTVSENAGTFSVTVTRTGGSAGACQILISAANGTLIQGTDYTGLPNTTISWNDGESGPLTLNYTMVDDALPESTEFVDLIFTVMVGNAQTGAKDRMRITVPFNDGGSDSGATVLSPPPDQPIDRRRRPHDGAYRSFRRLCRPGLGRDQHGRRHGIRRSGLRPDGQSDDRLRRRRPESEIDRLVDHPRRCRRGRRDVHRDAEQSGQCHAGERSLHDHHRR